MRKQGVAAGQVGVLLSQAITNLQQGKLGEAEQLLRKILQEQPGVADAHHLLGIIAMQRGQYNVAEQLISRAVQSNPGAAMYNSNLGYALYMQGRYQEALSAIEQAIRLDSNLPEAFFNAGNVLKELGRHGDAATAYDRATQLRPAYVDAYFNRGNLHLQAGRVKEAESDYRKVLQLNPAHARALNNLAVTLVGLGRYEEALAACDQAIRLRPNYAQAYNCRADALKKMRRLSEAMQSCDKAIELNPEYADAHYNRANMLLNTGHAADAEVSYRRALELSPDNPHLHSNVLFVQAARANQPFNVMLDALCQWDRVYGAAGRAALLPQRKKADLPGRLRIGYVSPHLRTNVVSFFFEPLLAAHDRSRFEVFCYASLPESRADEVTERLRRHAEHWRFVADKSDAELARFIHEDGIDILVDLAGHTEDNRLITFTYRPAPVQATYLGFFAATGLAAMDYWITDEVIHPADTQELSVEEIYRLPRCWVCYQPPESAPDVAPCPSADSNVVFGCFSQLSKVTTEVIETWSRLLNLLPESRLLVMANALADTKVCERFLKAFMEHEVSPERLILRKGEPYSQYFATYAEVDIVLDPFPRTGGTTTAEALWMGVPVVTLAGQRYVERISASKLTALGLTDLIATSREEYLEIALSLAHDPARRRGLRENLRARMAHSPLCDGPGLARAMESAYMTMWERYLAETAD